MDEKDERKKRLAAARQARYRARKSAEGVLFGVTITKKERDAVSAPGAQRALVAGRGLGPALTKDELAAMRLGQRVQRVLEEGGSKALGLKLAMKALDLL